MNNSITGVFLLCFGMWSEFFFKAFKKKLSDARWIIDIIEINKLNKDMKQKQKIWKKNCHLFKIKHESRKF